MRGPAALAIVASLTLLSATSSEARSPDDCDLPSSIGGATMFPDGTIALQLTALGPNGLIGDAYYEIGPSDPEFEAVKAHLGGISPGEDKPVPPWLPEHCSAP